MNSGKILWVELWAGGPRQGASASVPSGLEMVHAWPQLTKLSHHLAWLPGHSAFPPLACSTPSHPQEPPCRRGPRWSDFSPLSGIGWPGGPVCQITARLGRGVWVGEASPRTATEAPVLSHKNAQRGECGLFPSHPKMLPLPSCLSCLPGRAGAPRWQPSSLDRGG